LGTGCGVHDGVDRETAGGNNQLGRGRQRGPERSTTGQDDFALGVFAEFETNLRRERQLEGIAMPRRIRLNFEPNIDHIPCG
jgi:hypothetical protein